MPPTETIHKFSLEGPFTVGHLVCLGVVVAALSAWLAWRDCRGAGAGRLFAVLFTLRLVALGIVLWMLAGPTIVTLVRDSRPKSIVFLVDASGSMSLTDPLDGSGGTLRWRNAHVNSPDAPVLAALDTALGSLSAAQSGVNEIRQLSATRVSMEESQKSWDQVRQSITAAVDELNRVSTDATRQDAEAGAELSRISKLLNDGLQTSGGAKLSRQNLDEQLDETGSVLEAGRQRLERQAQKLAAAAEQSPTSRQRTVMDEEARFSRREKVALWLNGAETSWLHDLEDKAHILRYTFNTQAQPVEGHEWLAAMTNQSEALAGTTDLGAALGRAAQDAGKQSIGAVVLITDGGHNAAGDPRDAAAALTGVPLYVVPIGTSEMPRDVILHHTHAPRAVFKNDMVVVDAMVTAYSCEGEKLQVQLSSDGKVVDQQVLTASSAMFDGRVNFHWKATELGRHALDVRVIPLPREHSLDNNEAKLEVDVMEDTVRVLLADDLPRWEFRYLVNLFKRDKHIEFAQLLFEPNDDPGTAGARPVFPRDLDAWRRFRVVILGDVTPAQLPPSQQEMLRRYVSEDGGNLIVIAGETAMPEAFANQPLGDLIPSVKSTTPNPRDGFGLAVTSEGSVSVATQLENEPAASDRIWREMATKLPIYNLSAYSKPKPTSHVLIATTQHGQTGEQHAFLSWQYVGLGRVIYLAAPVTYELRYRNGDLYHHLFWGQLIRWAIARDMSGGSRTVRIATDKNLYYKGDAAQIVVRLTQTDGQAVANAQCSLQAIQDNKIIKLIELRADPESPGSYRGTYEDLPLGPITLRATGATVQTLLRSEGRTDPVDQVLNVDPKGTTEMSNPLCNLPLLQQIADSAGGSVVPPAAVAGALSKLNVTPEVRETILSRQPLWDNWILLWIFIGCLGAEWLVRRYWRMV